MIDLFEDVTKSLSEEEISYIPFVARLLAQTKETQVWLRNAQICHEIQNNFGKKISPVRVRMMIHYIRVNQILTKLVASQRGYRVAVDHIEIKKYKHSLIQRLNSINEVLASFNNQAGV